VSKSTEMYERARKRIPGGTQLLSKRPELFLPDLWPAYYRRARGVEVEDLDGRTYVDVTLHAVGACPLGFADPDVERAVIAAVRAGNMATLNCPEEVELAELLCELHPWAEMVRYTRGGGEAMAVAVRIARAATGRDRVAFCGYHGWSDWYIAANLDDPTALSGHLLPDVDPAGVPRGLSGTVVPFESDDRASFDTVTGEHGRELAAIVMEPARYGDPPAGFLEHVRDVAGNLGAVLVFDEITSGFRTNVGGTHLRLGVSPDVVVFAKAMSNGYPMGAVLGRREVMEAAERSFVSSTYWSERIGPAAALATIAKLGEHNVPEHLAAMGDRMRSGWSRLGVEYGLEITTKGIPPLPTFAFQYGDDSRVMATLFTQCMLDEGFLASGAFYASYAHQPAHVDSALEAGGRAFERIRSAANGGRLRDELRGGVAHAGPTRRGR
jgi:glutamate-1-semialdehyde 2,1-aminomutase